MENALTTQLGSVLFRTLELQPSLTLTEGIDRVMQLVPGIRAANPQRDAVHQYLTAFGRSMRPRAVINPSWLAQDCNVHYHFYLVSAGPGWLPSLQRQTASLADRISYHILYGTYDALIVLYGTTDQAASLISGIADTGYYDLVPFYSRKVFFFHRYLVEDSTGLDSTINTDIINQLVDNYETPHVQSERQSLETAKVILGPAWDIFDSPLPRISAYVGMHVQGGLFSLGPNALLEALLKDETLRTCLVHLFEVDTGLPFHYLAKLVCRDMAELDHASDLIGATRLGPALIRGETFITASGREEFPQVPSGDFALAVQFGPVLKQRFFQETASNTIASLGDDAVRAFNDLGGDVQLTLLSSLAELDRQLEQHAWDGERKARITAAIAAFARSILSDAQGAGMSGAVLELAPAAEGLVKRLLRLIIEAVYGRDYGRAQQELRLANKDLRRLTLGPAITALRMIKEHADFVRFHEGLDEDWLDRLDRFATVRNLWAHNVAMTNRTSAVIIGEVRQVLLEGIELMRWLDEMRQLVEREAQEATGRPPATPDVTQPHLIKLPATRQGRVPGIFISHTTADREIADRIAVGLKALNYPVWYAEWEIDPGDSIVDRINQALAQHDTLLVLLSPESVQSKWVQKELNSALMSQLNGQQVKVVPVLISQCDIPSLILDFKYIDMTGDFQDAFIELLNFLRKQKTRRRGSDMDS